MRIIGIALLVLAAAAACDDAGPSAASRTPPATVTRTSEAPAATAIPPTPMAAAAQTSTPEAAAPPVTATGTPAAIGTSQAPAATATVTRTPEAPAAAVTLTPEAAAPPPAGPGPVALEPALGGRRFQRPVELGGYPGGRLFVAEQDGFVLLLDRDGENEQVLLELRGKVRRSGNEEGLLSVALDPDFTLNHFLYAYYSASDPRRTVLSRFTVIDDAADPATELVVLEVEQPFSNHNGGAIRFGPDGMLYLGFGDGGAGGDPRGNGQDPSTLLGTIIRIDVREAGGAAPYAVPADNPLLEPPGARPEVWAYGFRNPWRMAFDPATGWLWVGDVGQDRFEEIDIVERGGNYGWNRLEGNDCYLPRSGCDAGGTVAPVASYGHDQGCSVTGGAVYRGDAVPAIAGWYLYADFCSGRVWALPADLRSGPVVVVESARSVASFGVDEEGEIYLLAFDGPILRLTALAP